MFTINNKRFRQRELSRLRAEKLRKTRRELSAVGQTILLSDNNYEDQISIDVEVPGEVFSTNNSVCATDPSPVCEQVTEEIFNDDSLLDIEMSDDSKQNNQSNLESSVDEQFRNLTVTSDSEGESDINNTMDNLNFLEKIKQWALMFPPLPHARLEQLMDILREEYPEIPKSAKTFLGTNKTDYKIETFSKNEEFIYFGIKGNLEKCVNTKLHETNDIDLLINIDGVPLFKSSRKQLWPILCQVFSDYNCYKPFPVAIYCGNNKPSDVELYLKKFIEEVNDLQTNGIRINNCLFNITIKAFVCDRPARSFIKCMKNHGGYYACERCTVSGKRFKKRTVYPLVGTYEPRTDDAFRSQSNPEHHIGKSPLLNIEPKIDLVNQFVLDSMHLLFLGVMKKLLECWIDGSVNKKLKISNNDKTRLSNLLTQIEVPSEFQRSTRSLTDFHKFKATEFQFLFLYAGPVVFKKILPKTINKHFLLLHIGCRILFSKEIALKKVKYAKYAKYYLSIYHSFDSHH